jgi:hypothetical protein
MATRGTYEIESQTFYCHWDNYPEGGAYRLAKMVEALTQPSADERPLDAIEDRRGGLAFAFIRGNMDAEPTESHEEHGDTEYRYTVKTKDGRAHLRVDERTGYGPEATWKAIYTGPLAEWKLMAEQEVIEAQMPQYGGNTRPVLATKEAAAKIKTREAKIAGHFGTMPDGRENPNKATHIAQMRAWGAALNEAEAPAPDTFIEA